MALARTFIAPSSVSSILAPVAALKRRIRSLPEAAPAFFMVFFGGAAAPSAGASILRGSTPQPELHQP